MEIDANGFPLPIIWVPTPDEKVIYMCRGYSTLVSAIDYDYLNSFRWTPQIDKKHGTVYVRRHKGPRGASVKIYMHREITKCPKGLVVDHKNGIGLDNTRRNLRIVSHYENDHNKQFFKGKYYRGVTKAKKRFRARISINMECFQIGCFATPKEAALAYDKKARELFGEFAVVNFPDEKLLETPQDVMEDIPF